MTFSWGSILRGCLLEGALIGDFIVYWYWFSGEHYGDPETLDDYVQWNYIHVGHARGDITGSYICERPLKM